MRRWNLRFFSSGDLGLLSKDISYSLLGSETGVVINLLIKVIKLQVIKFGRTEVEKDDYPFIFENFENF